MYFVKILDKFGFVEVFSSAILSEAKDIEKGKRFFTTFRMILSEDTDKFGFVEFFDFAQSDSVCVGTGLPDGPQILLY